VSFEYPRLIRGSARLDDSRSFSFDLSPSGNLCRAFHFSFLSDDDRILCILPKGLRMFGDQP